MAIDWDKHVVAPTNKVFGEPVIYRPKSGGSYTINGVFDRSYHETMLLAGDQRGFTLGGLHEAVPVGTEVPVLGVRVKDLPGDPEQDDEVDIPSAGETYIVKEPKPDGHGHAKLMLAFKAAFP